MTKQQALRNLMGDNNQTEFAKKHGLKQVRISEWLRGVRNISNNTLAELAVKEGYSLGVNYKLEKI